MSATLRHDVGLAAGRLLMIHAPVVMKVFGAAHASRWGGVNKTRHEVITFAIHLPGEIKEAHVLVGVMDFLLDDDVEIVVGRSLVALRDKIVGSIGMLPNSNNLFWRLGLSPLEVPLVESIKADPADLLNWYAYRDWLLEQTDPSRVRRGRSMSAWLDPRKAAKTKYGKIVLDRD